MNDIISCKVRSIKFDEDGKYCLIKFWVEDSKSTDQLKRTSFYTIVNVSELRAYGGVPSYFELTPVRKIENSEHFQIESTVKPARFIEISRQGLFWKFNETNITYNDITAYIKMNYPSVFKDFTLLFSKHFLEEEARFKK